jgi:hypothetical protein
VQGALNGDPSGAYNERKEALSVEPWIPPLIGVVIGAIPTVIVVIVQTRQQAKLERAKLALTAAMAERDFFIKNSPRGAFIAPLSSFVHFHHKFLKLIETDKLTDESYEALCRERSEIAEMVRRYSSQLKD